MKTYRQYWLLALGLCLGSCDILFPPTANPLDCTNDATICKPTEVCDPVQHICQGGGGCTSSVSCINPAASFCSNQTCIPCAVDTQCKGWSDARNQMPGRPWCNPIQGKNTCVQCRTNADCPDPASPACDGATGLCRGCLADSECVTTAAGAGSGLCRKAGDYPDTSPTPMGQCIPPTQVSFVNNNTQPCLSSGTTSSLAMPFCNMGLAITAAKTYINVASSGTNYPPFTVSSGSFVVTGPGRDAKPTAQFEQVTVSGTGTLVVSDLQVNPMPANANPAISCVSPVTGAASLYVVKTAITTVSGRGIDTSQECGKLVVDRCAVNANKTGIYIGGGGNVVTNFTVVNTSVVGSMGEPYGVRFNDKASPSGYFGFNTVTGNLNGVNCTNTGGTITNSIVALNTITQVNASCTAGITVYQGNKVDFVNSPTDLRLIDDMNNANCCIDHGSSPTGSVQVPTDFFGNVRPQGAYDIGFHELK